MYGPLTLSVLGVNIQTHFLVNNVSHRDVHKRTRHIPTCPNLSLFNVSPSLTWQHTQTQTWTSQDNNKSTPLPRNHRFSGERRKTQKEQREQQQKQQMGQDDELWRQHGGDEQRRRHGDDFYNGERTQKEHMNAGKQTRTQIKQDGWQQNEKIRLMWMRGMGGKNGSSIGDHYECKWLLLPERRWHKTGNMPNKCMFCITAVSYDWR